MSIAVPLYGFGTGGSGSYTGPKVIGSPTQPSNPKDNTVWVQTSTPISSWEMSEVVTPGWDTAPAGFVYFTTSTSDWTVPNLVRFVKRNEGNVFLKATRCWQNLGTPGATQWTSMNAYIYHNDTWTQFSNTRSTPEFTYTGDYAIVDDSDNLISDFAKWTGNWKIRFLTSGTLTFTNLNGAADGIDLFLVGGGGGSSTTSANVAASGGGGGGYTVTATGIAVNVGTSYSIIVGAGGSVGTAGGVSSAFGKTASGGNAGVAARGDAKGGDGGSGGGAGGAWQQAGGNGGSDGGDGISTGLGNAGAGQGTTTREFGESSGKLYSGGGGGGTFEASVSTGGAGGGANGSDEANGISAAANTGGGAGGAGVSNLYGYTGAKGGSGIVIARNARGAA